MKEPSLGFIVGGQAVIEGVMMRTPASFCVAVRKKEGDIVEHTEKIKVPQIKIPLIRGVYVLFHALSLGIKSLNISANLFEEEKPLSTFSMIMSIFFALFFTEILRIKNNFYFNLIDGLFRLIIFLIYILILNLFKDFKRFFAYHGAEHKVVHTYEAGEELTIENARGKSPLHPRCGTSFLLFVVVLSIFVFSLIPNDLNFVSKFSFRLLLLPFIAGISYEAIRLSYYLRNNIIGKALSLPGLMLQKLTTREPDDSMLEVAIFSLKKALNS
ncbi:MAG: DUF1385 domain-containing protein [Thermoanaerobaculia bacterium]